jgi:hypothetical protein
MRLLVHLHKSSLVFRTVLLILVFLVVEPFESKNQLSGQPQIFVLELFLVKLIFGQLTANFNCLVGHMERDGLNMLHEEFKEAFVLHKLRPVLFVFAGRGNGFKNVLLT